MLVVMRQGLLVVSVVPIVMGALAVSDQSAATRAAVAALQQGGHVIVMRHARSPAQLPTARTAETDNVTRERQLDEQGRRAAVAMGEAFRRLGIPRGSIVSSPAYRARQTATLAGWTAVPTPELGDIGQAMASASQAEVAYLRGLVRKSPAAGNTVVITHSPNIVGAFPEAGTVGEGEALIFLPDGRGNTRLIARVTADEWPSLSP
jgi:phosphohistidine phosphatase SixA